MEWSNDLTLQLIELYREKGCLWDPTDNTYKLRNAKADAWNELGVAFKCSAAEVKKKMDSLLASFRRERQRQIKSGAGADEVYNSSWFAFKSMVFLMDKFAPRNTQSTIDEVSKKVLFYLVLHGYRGLYHY